MSRPPVSVIVPFYGGREEAVGVVGALRRLQVAGDDELIVADNTPGGVAETATTDGVTHVAAGQVQSSYFARNAGAETARNDWLLFMDADCEPHPGLLDAYFAEPVSDAIGAIAGEVVGSGDQASLAARYSRSRRHIGQAEIQDHPYKPMAVTANLLVRRAVWEQLGGFHEGVRSGGDADFSWRLQDAGYELGYVPTAIVEHRHRETVRALLRQSARYGAGMRWLGRRHPEVRFDGRTRAIARSLAGVAAWTLTGRFERALFKALDGAWTVANVAGSLASNVHTPPPATGAGITIVVGRFPDPTTAQPAALGQDLTRSALSVVVESAERAPQPDRRAAKGLAVRYLEDDGPLRRLMDVCWLIGRHPMRCAGDLARRARRPGRSLVTIAPSARRIARRGDAGIRTFGGDPAAGDGARLGRLLGIGVSEVEPASARGSAEPVAS